MKEFYQILTVKTGALNEEGDIVHYFYGPEGWIEKCEGQTVGYRLIQQRATANGMAISQIVERMQDGWIPSQILFRDVAIRKWLGDGQNVADVGGWQQTFMVVPLPLAAPVAAATQSADRRGTQMSASQQTSLLGQAPRQQQRYQQQKQQPNIYSATPLSQHSGQVSIPLVSSLKAAPQQILSHKPAYKQRNKKYHAHHGPSVIG